MEVKLHAFFTWALEEFLVVGLTLQPRYCRFPYGMRPGEPRASSGPNHRQNTKLSRNLKGYLEIVFLGFDNA